MSDGYYAKRYRRYKASGKCVICRRAPAKDGVVRCEQCHSRMLSEQHAKIESGICFRCNGQVDGARKGVCVACAEIHDLKRDAARRRNLDSGRCYTCNRKRAPGNVRYCAKHVAKHKKYNRAYRKRIRARQLAKVRIELTTCPMCSGPKSYQGDVCINCRPLTAGAIHAIAAMADGSWRTIGEIATASGLTTRSVYRAIAKVNAGNGLVEIRYDGAAKASPARYRLTKSPSWYRP